MAVSQGADSLITVKLVDAHSQASRSLSISAKLVVPSTITGSAVGVRDMPTLIATERVIERINGTGFALPDEQGKHAIAEILNKCFIPIPEDRWQSTKLDLRAEVMATEVQQRVGNFVQSMRSPLLPGALQYVGASQSGDPDALPKLADALYTQTRQTLAPQRSVWQDCGPRIARFVGKCALEGIVSTIFGAPVGFFLDWVFE